MGPNDQSKIDRLKRKDAGKYGMVKKWWDTELSIDQHDLLDAKAYRMDFTVKDLEGANDKVKTAMSMNNASLAEIKKVRNKYLIQRRFGSHEHDVGSPGVQAAMYCEKTISVMNHLRKNHRDISGVH